jgi:hypothetical protein
VAQPKWVIMAAYRNVLASKDYKKVNQYEWDIAVASSYNKNKEEETANDVQACVVILLNGDWAENKTHVSEDPYGRFVVVGIKLQPSQYLVIGAMHGVPSPARRTKEARACFLRAEKANQLIIKKIMGRRGNTTVHHMWGGDYNIPATVDDKLVKNKKGQWPETDLIHEHLENMGMTDVVQVLKNSGTAVPHSWTYVSDNAAKDQLTGTVARYDMIMVSCSMTEMVGDMCVCPRTIPSIRITNV